MAQRCSASSTSTTRKVPAATWTYATTRGALMALAVLAAVLPLHTGAMYLPSAPAAAAPAAPAVTAPPPPGAARGKCVDGHAVPAVPVPLLPEAPEALAMTSGLTTTDPPRMVETTESPTPASTTLDSIEAPTTLPSVMDMAASSVTPLASGALTENTAETSAETSSSTDALGEVMRDGERSIAQQRREVEDSLNELFTRASSRLGRYAAGFPQVQPRSLFSRRMSLVPPPPPLPYEVAPEVSKDVYIHLAADETTPTTPVTPSLPPRKHYKIIVIKPPTPAPPVETTTRRVDVETLIYVLVPKGEAPSPAPTTPHAPSKHEVFFIRYKAPVENKTTSVDSAETKRALVLDSPTSTSTTATIKPPTNVGNFMNHVDLRSSSSELRARTTSDEDENELDGTVGDSEAINDLLSVSTDDIVRSWRRVDGDIHFDADLKRIARSHSTHVEFSAKDASRDGAQDFPEEVVQGAALPPARCRQYATAEDLNAALDVGDEEGKRVQGAPDFNAVLQGKAHYGGSAEVAEICAEKSASEPFAIREVPAAAELELRENDPQSQRKDLIPKTKFSARYASSLVF